MSIEHFGMCWQCSFDSGIAKTVVARGDIPAVDWSTDSASDAQVASGAYDSYITSVARSMASFGHPMFLLFEEEMNGTWYDYSPGQNGNTAHDFVAMWRHVHDLFVQAGATNVTWVWAPNVDPEGMFTSFSSVYPGDAYVDWTGLNGYNWGSGDSSGWMSFSSIFSTSYKALLALAPSKPIMIGEVASEEQGGSKAAWITDALSTQLPQNFPKIKAVLWFNWRINEMGRYWNWEMESSASSQKAFSTAVASPYYAAGGSFGSLPLGTKVPALT
jgi:beta-mannanase